MYDVENVQITYSPDRDKEKFRLEFRCKEFDEFPDCKNFYISVFVTIKDGKIVDIKETEYRGDHWDEDHPHSRCEIFFVNPLTKEVHEQNQWVEMREHVKEFFLKMIQEHFPPELFLERVRNKIIAVEQRDFRGDINRLRKQQDLELSELNRVFKEMMGEQKNTAGVSDRDDRSN